MAEEQRGPSRNRKQNYDKSGKKQARRDQRYAEAVARAKEAVRIADRDVLNNKGGDKQVLDGFVAVRSRAISNYVNTLRKSERK